ncbi:MAG: bifunctional DNA-formamidopyrimidine glycosylase/DNA-(apurinic or apyrimidinic site) lyase, partial [Candidatus Pacebacteria bacterium]|nr:bifunctional DNA-formamidopyrimidine glycosylase/DNA-(apurinic or apyrimidinic site) lyase [Candidatus Paceibacterota bacterium]
MPELPEVQTTVNGLNRTVKGLKVIDVWTNLKTKDPRQRETIK